MNQVKDGAFLCAWLINIVLYTEDVIKARIEDKEKMIKAMTQEIDTLKEKLQDNPGILLPSFSPLPYTFSLPRS